MVIGAHRPRPQPAPAQLRVTEVLAALSLTTDLASGLAFEKGLQTCLVATAFAGELALGQDTRRVVFQAALLRAIGCTAHAPENAAFFADDIAFQATLKTLDPGDPGVFATQLAGFGSWAGRRQSELAGRFAAIAATEGPAATRAGCEVSRALGTRLGLEAGAVAALDQVYERWDGRGLPDGIRADQLLLTARIVHLAEQAVLAHATGGMPGAVAEISRRSGGHLDPSLAAAFCGSAEVSLAPLRAEDLLAEVLVAEPGPVAHVPFGDLDRLCLALAAVADLKGRYLAGHSVHVARIAAGAAQLAGLSAPDVAAVRAAGLLHDLGRTGVSSEIWDRRGPLGAADTERVRLHSYWTARVLERCPSLASLSVAASSHHERVDGSGYHRGTADLPLPARLIAAADIFSALVADRPHRPAMSRAAAGAVLTREVSAGRLDAASAGAVLEAAGLPRPDVAYPCDLTGREVQVLRLAARGWANRRIGDELGISARTVGHHLAHIYDKTGRRTRAGVAVFAMEHDLFPGQAGPDG